jgi:hypothetical protein
MPGAYGRPCSGGATPCGPGLTCVSNLCTVACTDTGPCLQFSNTAICEGYCYEPCETASQCPPGLTCAQVASLRRTCRVQ